MATITGYLLTEELFSKGNQSFHFGIREEDNHEVFLKVLENTAFDSLELSNLKREYGISIELDNPGFIKTRDFVEFNGGAALVMDRFSGGSIRDYIEDRQVPIRDFLIIAINICDALGYLHSIDVVHKDIKPSNILVDPDNLDIKIIDFGIASLIPQEEFELENTKVLEGTLAYISPEQTGRMNRALDYRSDLYSLGVTFYEIVLGRTPFLSDDPIEMVHAHLAVLPTSPDKIIPNIPKVISPIIMKLLEKTPEDRYKSTTGLKADLERCLHNLDNIGSVPEFEVGQNDHSDRLNVPQKLYGREDELKTLLSSFDKACHGESQVFLVSGNPGIGKSALINEIHKPIVVKRGIFIRGKFDQFQRNIPYSALINAFNELIDGILSKSDLEIAEWRERVLSKVGAYGQLIVDILPNLEVIIGKQNKILSLPPAEALNRFHLTFRNFFQAFTDGPNSLVVFLDDLQWADSASLDLMQFILADQAERYLMVIGAFRDNEVGEDHPLSKIIREAKANREVNHVHLEAIKKRDLTQLLADMFLCEANRVKELSRLIEQKTKCNPFFIFEFLKSLYKKKLVFFDYQKREWNWSVKEIEQSNITDNVVELVTDLLKSLSPETLNLCSLAACIGNKFDLKTLSVVNDKGIQTTSEELWPAIKEGVIIPVTSNYKAIGNNSDIAKTVSYKFLHDRVQQAAYTIIPEKERKEIHLRIGNLLRKDAGEEASTSQLFDIVNHLNFGISLLSPAEKLELSKLNYKAGVLAKASSAFNPAFLYFNTAVSLLPKTIWKDEYLFALNLHNEAAETAYLSLKEQELDGFVELILKHSKTHLDTVKAYTIKIQYYGSQGNSRKAVESSFVILDKLQVRLPQKPNQFHVLIQLIKTKFRLRNKSVDDIVKAPEMKSEQWLSAMSVLSIVTGPAYIANTNLFILIVFKMIELSLRYGNNRFNSFAYGVYGMVLSGMSEFDNVQKFGLLSKRLLEMHKADEMSCKVNYVLDTLKHIHHSYEDSEKMMLKNIQLGLNSGDFLYAGYATVFDFAYRLYSNQPLDVISFDAQPHLKQLTSLKQNIALIWIGSLMQFVENARSKEGITYDLNGTYFNEVDMLAEMVKSRNNTGICLMYVFKSHNAFLFDDFENALDFLDRSGKILDNLVGTPWINLHLFLSALTQVALNSNTSGMKKYKVKSVVKKGIKEFEKWSLHAKENNFSKLEILKACLAFLNNDRNGWNKHLTTSTQYAEENNQLYDVAIGYELKAKFHQSTQEISHFEEAILASRYWYNRWGATAKVNQLDTKYKLKQKTEVNRKSSIISTDKSSVFSAEALDLQTVVKSSQALSSIVKLDELFQQMTSIVMENAGATRCTFLLRDGEKWFQEITKDYEAKKSNEKFERILVTEKNQDKLSIPLSVAHYVLNTNENLVINNIKEDTKYSNDRYFKSANPSSVLCFPFSSKGEMSGLIYLENDLTKDAFTRDRIKTLSLISAQIAISLENALLYRNLEDKVEERTADLVRKNDELELEKGKSEKLLLNILPVEVAQELKDSGSAKAKKHPHATVLFCDVKGFTTIAESLPPEELVHLLDKYFVRFDDIISKHGLEKIKTIGDAYMAVGGVPSTNKATAKDVVFAAKDILDLAKKLEIEHKAEGIPYFQIRVGIHTGPVVSGIVGKSKFQFDIWGDTVNVAARLEQNSVANRINISKETFEEIKEEFNCTSRGLIPVRNRGEIEMFFVDY